MGKMLGGEEEKDPDAQKKEEERQEALRQQEEERKAKHARMEAEREKVRQSIRDKVSILFSPNTCGTTTQDSLNVTHLTSKLSIHLFYVSICVWRYNEFKM